MPCPKGWDGSSKIKYHYVIIDYFGEVIGGILRAGTDVIDARWFGLDELNNIETSPTVRKALGLYEKFR